MRVREGSISDWPFVYGLGKEVISDSISPWREQPLMLTLRYREKFLKEFWTWMQQTGSKLFIAENEREERLGYIVLHPAAIEELTGLAQGWVMDLAVLPEQRRQGIGKLLLQYAEKYCRDKGLSYLGLAVSSHNTHALKLYLDNGFVEERKLMVKILKE